uniref:Helicase ATP-binding domain-containing protein n=1 Tax=Varanus komodoensis TaxID=61221 RepID=A0A8D2J6W6_VARKO
MGLWGPSLGRPPAPASGAGTGLPASGRRRAARFCWAGENLPWRESPLAQEGLKVAAALLSAGRSEPASSSPRLGTRFLRRTRSAESLRRSADIPPLAYLVSGGTQIADRRELWRQKQVFFLTPQIMANDLSRGICPAAEVKCLVIDEAHRALGNHAYCQVVKELWKHTQHFRILALTATPGSDAKAVQQVISNLLISHIELYTEDSPEIQPYSYQRQIEKCVVPLGKDLAEIQNAYIQVLEAFTSRLTRLRILSHRDIPTLTKYQIILARDQFRKNPAPHLAVNFRSRIILRCGFGTGVCGRT